MYVFRTVRHCGEAGERPGAGRISGTDATGVTRGGAPMGNLRNMSANLIATRLDVLEVAGWTQKDWEGITEEGACEMLKLVKPAEIARGMDTETQITRIIAWYEQHGATKLSASDISRIVPKRKPGFDRLIVVAPGMTPNRCCESLQRQFGAEKLWRSHDDLDCAVESVRKTDKLYAVWVRDRQEADDESANKSADQFEQKNCETLEERLIHEGLYFQEHKKHLDVVNVTLCAGSRARDGGLVPSVGFDSAFGQVYVGAFWCDPSLRVPGLRVRSVVLGKKAS